MHEGFAGETVILGAYKDQILQMVKEDPKQAVDLLVTLMKADNILSAKDNELTAKKELVQFVEAAFF